MKISEIFDSNQTWISLTGIQTDFNERYALLNQALSLYSKVKWSSHVAQIKHEMTALTKDIDKVTAIKFPDETDPDIIAIKNRLREIKLEIETKFQ
jgi:hypothetical protein